MHQGNRAVQLSISGRSPSHRTNAGRLGSPGVPLALEDARVRVLLRGRARGDALSRGRVLVVYVAVSCTNFRGHVAK